MDGKLVAVFRHAHEVVDVGAVEAGIDALAEHVHGQRDDVDIAGALAIAEERAFDPVGASQKAELGRGHGAAAIVVRVERDGHAVTLLDVTAEPLDLVGVDIGRRHLHRGGEVEDQLLLRRRLIAVDHRLADVLGEVELGAGEALGRILVADDLLYAELTFQLADEVRALHCDVDDFRRGRA